MVSSQDSSLYNIKKLDGTNFSLRKKKIWHVLVQKKQLKPIKLKGIQLEDMDEDEWNKMDELALSTIMLTLAKSVYFNVADEVSNSDLIAFVSIVCMASKRNSRTNTEAILKRDTQLALPHSDLCEPIINLSLGGATYFITFIDDYSRKVDGALNAFKTFVTHVENQSGKKLKCLCTDNGGEYVSKAFQDFCESKGIKRELTASYSPLQNGVVGRMNRTIQEKVRSMLSNAHLTNGFWAEAIATVVHLINGFPSKVLEKDSVVEMV
ncbi:hypothetical protein L7F22_016775 [Adiantum nelumboides]|nr:hypothetical protein [Adiantum nelumboides]